MCAARALGGRGRSESTRELTHDQPVLASCNKESSPLPEVVANKPTEPPAQLPLFDEPDEPTSSAKAAAKKTAEPSRHPWAYLLQRVFAVDVLKCERCGGRLRLVEIATKRDDISRVLGDLGYARAPPSAPPRAESSALVHGQLRLAFG